MKNLEETELHRAFGCLEVLVEKMVRILGSTDSTNRGGYFCLANDVDPPDKHHRSLRRYGRVIDDNAFERYRRNAQEKVGRLLVEMKGDLTSWRSRDPEKHRYGGGIRISFNDTYLVMAFSGFPEHCDEALMLALAVRMRWLENASALTIAANNDVRSFLRQLLTE